MKEKVANKVKNLPDKPGCYIYKDEAGTIIYVGKAVNLKNRVRSYFNATAKQGVKTQALVERIADLEYIITDSEVEALVLELNLIKEHRPRYNIMLKDDKTYPYVKVTLGEAFPRVIYTRQVKSDGSKYYGPYVAAGAIKETLQVLRTIFPLRTCSNGEFKNRSRPCLYAQIGQCLGPCVGSVDEAEYGKMIRDVMAFLDGKEGELLKGLKKDMEEAAENLQFEKAALRRDQIRAVEQALEKQKIISGGQEDRDVIAMARGIGQACVMIFFVRGGKVVGRDSFFLSGTDELERGEILASFVEQYYDHAEFIPPELLLECEVSDGSVIGEWLKKKRGAKVELKVPQRGEKYQLVEMVGKNALLTLEQREREVARKEERTSGAVKELQKGLHLDVPPWRIECYDISNTQGTESVASMVVFEGGEAKKQDYRRFRIKTVEGPNDFASMQEVLGRRFKRGQEEQQLVAEGKLDPMNAKFARLPDLLIVDGGKGQLGYAREIMRELGVERIPTFGLAKENEWLFREGDPDPIILPRRSPALYLVQRIRDEAHRFAITYHRALRAKRNLESLLDAIPGVGPKRKKALLDHFGSLKKIRAATPEALAEVEGISLELGEGILTHLNKG